MSELGAVPAAAVSAFDLSREDMNSAMPVLSRTPASHLALNHLEGLRNNDCLMISLHIVLRDLAFVCFGFLCQ